MDYRLHQRGRASIDFLVDLRRQSDKLEKSSDQFAQESGLTTGLTVGESADDLEALQRRIAPAMQACPDFRILRLMREWQLDQHGWLAMDAFEEIRVEVEPALSALQEGPAQLTYADELSPPDYWKDQEFHRTAGGWDGHDYMGFVHGELIHRHMVGETYAGPIYAQRKSVAAMAPAQNPKKIFEIGCASGQFTAALAETFPDSELWACDLSPRQLEQTQRLANETGASWHLLQAAAEDTALDDEQFDLVASYAVFHELPTGIAREVLRESHRLLKPGAYMVIGDVTPYHVQDAYSIWKADFWNQVHGGDPFWREYATTNLADLALAAGFSEAKWSGAGESHYPFVMIARK